MQGRGQITILTRFCQLHLCIMPYYTFTYFRKMLRKMTNKVQTDEDNTTPTSGQEGDIVDGVLTGDSH